YDKTKRSNFTPPHRPTSALLTGVRYTGSVPQITDTDRVHAREDLKYWRVSVVILTPDPHETALLATLEQLLGPAQKVSDVWLWDIRTIYP
ncbi:MAG: hypothetical protein HOQ05_12775, partial [Corynebacteriales bacterium]|nr:hypothetical protein [Mycobacteriales bacterium]